MPLTPEQLAKIREKEESLDEAHRRNPLNDYTEGWFHITLNVRKESPILGRVIGDVAAPDDAANAPRCVLTKLGEGVEKSWNANPSFYPGIENLAFQVMPDHVHGLVHLKPGNKKHLGQIVYGFMVGCTHAYWDTLGIPWREMTYVKGARAPEWQDPDHTRSLRGPALFTRGYNDVEAVTEEEIEIKREYIRNNPRKLLITRSKRDSFSVQRQRTSRNWHLDAVKRGLCADRFFRLDATALDSALATVLPRLNSAPSSLDSASSSIAHSASSSLHLDVVGNVSLLAAERKLPLICHRADASRFGHQKAAVLQAARNGAVIVSAFISPKERDILKQLLQESLPVIEVMDNGFSDRYKPTGQSFYAMAEERLCQITPWTYVYQRDVKVSREMCMVMNELVRVVSTEKEDWWKR